MAKRVLSRRGGPLLVAGRQQDLPHAPPEIAEAVELYAREWRDGHGTLTCVPFSIGRGGRVLSVVWVAKFTLRPNDKRMKAYQEHGGPEPPVEEVWFQVPDKEARTGWRPLNIAQMGTDGVKTFLEQGNMWSGRGVYDSPADQLTQTRTAAAAQKVKVKADARDATIHEQRDRRRSRFKIPFLTVGIDLLKKAVRRSTASRASRPAGSDQRANAKE